MKKYFILFLFSLPVLVFAQSASDKLNPKKVNVAFLEQLTFDEINKIRETRNKNHLYPDSILLDAAKNHANYLAIKNKLTHYQKENKSLKDPQLRVEFFGANDIQTGENILMFPLGVGVKMDNGKKENPISYEEYARLLVAVWMNSKPHKVNILSNEFNLSAIAISLNKNKDTLYAVQVFGDPIGEHEYVFPQESFPYAKIPDEKKNFLFKSYQIKSPKKYSFGIKLPEKFSDCPKSSNKKWMEVDASLNITRDKMLLCIYDLNQIRNFFPSAKDGLAVELVSFKNQFSCNNEYKPKPNTRNGFSYLDGELMKPIYRNEIEKQRIELQEKASKRKKSKKEEKTCNYFDLGPTPENFTDYPYEVKLHYIKNKKFCVQIKFDSHCGQLLVYKPAALPIKYTIDTVTYVPSNKQTSLRVEVGFEKNAVEFNGADMEEVISQLKNQEFKVNSIDIKAYASVEGSEKANEKLFKKRADVLIKELEKYQTGKIKYTLHTKENWDLFYKQIDTTEHYSMRVWKKDRVKQFFKDSVNAFAFEPFLKEQRNANITLTITPIQSNKWKQLMAYTEWKSIIKDYDASQNIDDENINRLDVIQCFLQSKKEENVSEVSPEELEIPRSKYFVKAQYRDFLFAVKNGKTYDPNIAVEKLKRWNTVLQDREVDYNIKAIIANHSNEFSSKEKITLIRSLLAELKTQNANEQLINDIELWFNVEMANLIYRGHESNFVDRATSLLKFIKENYLAVDSSQTRKIELAKYFISFEKYSWARELLEPMVHVDSPNKKAMVLYIKYCLNYELSHFPSSYYAELKRAHNLLSEKQWCSLFIGTCNIPLKALDWPSLRALYCESCMN